MTELEITHSLPKGTRQIDWYIGKQTKLYYTLNGRHDVEITLKIGWSQEDFMEAVCASFTSVYLDEGEVPKTIHVTKLEEDLSVLN